MDVVIVYDHKNKADALLAALMDAIVSKCLPERVQIENVRTEETIASDNRHAVVYNLPVSK